MKTYTDQEKQRIRSTQLKIIEDLRKADIPENFSVEGELHLQYEEAVVWVYVESENHVQEFCDLIHSAIEVSRLDSCHVKFCFTIKERHSDGEVFEQIYTQHRGFFDKQAE